MITLIFCALQWAGVIDVSWWWLVLTILLDDDLSHRGVTTYTTER